MSLLCVALLGMAVCPEVVDAQLSDRTPKTVSSDPSGSGQSQFIGAKSVWGRGPRGDETCAEGKCQKFARADLLMCSGLCREYYPQVRKFINDILPKYTHVRLLDADNGNGSAKFVFYKFAQIDNFEGHTEEMAVNGMFAHEMEEELQKRGILPSTRATPEIGAGPSVKPALS